METSSRTKRFLVSDLRGIRVTRLSLLYVADLSSRVRCCEVLQDIKEQETDHISSRECGFIVRECFPEVKRIHSNHVYYYSGIRRILGNDIGTQDENGVVIQKEIKLDHGIPRSMFIKRGELARSESPVYDFDNGVGSTTMMKSFRGMCVAVREYETEIISQAKVVLNVPSHPCLPVLIGLCCEIQPYLLVTKFYGFAKFGLMLSVSAALAESKKKKINALHWMSIVCDIAQGLLHMHTNRFVHGDLRPCNIILHKKSGCINNFFQPVFLNLDKASQIQSVGQASKLFLIENDVKMFQHLVERVLDISCTDHRKFQTIIDMTQLQHEHGRDSQILKDIVVYCRNIVTKNKSS